jgi:hypothetical protein
MDTIGFSIQYSVHSHSHSFQSVRLIAVETESLNYLIFQFFNRKYEITSSYFFNKMS